MVYFFYGTLCDADVLKLILGYRPSPRQLRAARLPGWRRKRARGRSYPVLLRATGGSVTGLLFWPARATDTPRLTAYEGPEYIARNLTVRQRQPQTAPVPRRPAPGYSCRRAPAYRLVSTTGPCRAGNGATRPPSSVLCTIRVRRHAQAARHLQAAIPD